ncbi:hypothetical protein ONZ45_g12819 [Pleurotus djamor]|nr:hypothetical protein ONZ45_g12819 [Pleurotus djamor]
MTSFNRLFDAVLLTVIYVAATSAAPFAGNAKFGTHRNYELARGLQLEAFHPPSTFETFGTGIDHPLSKRDNPDLEESSMAFVESKLNVDKAAIKLRTSFTGETAKHAFLRQVHDGIPFANAVANVAFNHDNKVVSFGSSFVKPTKFAASKPTLALDQAIAKAEQLLDGKDNGHPPTLEFLALQDGSAALTHVIQIQNDETGAWVEAFIDAHTGELRSVTDFVNKATYFALPIAKQLPTEGFEFIVNPEDPLASPIGWLSTDGVTTSTVTAGNNVIVTGRNGATTPQPFSYTFNPAAAPTVPANANLANVNAFYVVNIVHDFSYRYGFTEAAFNFQVNNFGKGGLGNDRITVAVQNTAGTNNADFATPPDGQSGRSVSSTLVDGFFTVSPYVPSPHRVRILLLMLAGLPNSVVFLWTLTSPQRDGALENDLLVHENTHGITSRMTGGGTGRCLQTTEAAGMGEGWSDAMAEWTEHKSAEILDYVLGQWVSNNPAGIRSHPYSTSAYVRSLFSTSPS